MVASNIEGVYFVEAQKAMGNDPLQIVVVDDESQITDLIQFFIESLGKPAGIHTFNDSRQAREYLKSNSVDVLITDYKMPFVSGLELLEAAAPEVRKILISGYVSEIAVDKIHQMKATFFEKPVPMKELSRSIFEG
jgi:two-component system response regulator YesN